MNWIQLPDLNSRSEWLELTASGMPPLTYEVLSPEEIRGSIGDSVRHVEELGAEITSLPSGLAAFRFDVRENEAPIKVENAVSVLTKSLDPDREWLEEADENADSRPRGHVQHEFASMIDSIRVLGPGGRLLKQLVGSTAIFDVSVHPRRLDGSPGDGVTPSSCLDGSRSPCPTKGRHTSAEPLATTRPPRSK